MTTEHGSGTGETMPRKPKAGVAAEVTLTLRMTEHDRALLDRLVALRAEELAELGADEIEVTAASYVRGLIRREAKAKGVTAALAAQEPSAKPPAPSPAPEAPPTPAARTPEEAEAAEVHAALVRAIDAGATQAQIAERAGVDAGALSKFKKSGSGLSPEKLKKLRRALS